jgi:ABC-2 type transport system ATP-binding protein
MSPTVEVRDLRRVFGEVIAVRGISFDIEAGQVLGFMGANGSGKTTTMRIMATLDMPDAGHVRIAGHDVMEHPQQVRRVLGWMPDSYGAYPAVTVYEYLDFHARACGFRGAARRRQVDELMEFTDLGELAERPMDSLSKGMGQRLCLGRALLHDPQVLLLDEPAAGLDPKARIDFKRLVRLLAEDGKTLFISSHILSELEEMCDALLFIDEGRVVHHGSSASLKESPEGGSLVEVRVAGDVARLREWALLRPGIEIIDSVRAGLRLRLAATAPEEVAAVLTALVGAGIPVIEFRHEGRRLEDAFVDVLEKARA